MEVILLVQVCFALLTFINKLWPQDLHILHLSSLSHTLGVCPIRNHQAVIAWIALNVGPHVFTELSEFYLFGGRGNVKTDGLIMEMADGNGTGESFGWFDLLFNLYFPLGLNPFGGDILKYFLVLFEIDFSILSRLIVIIYRIFVFPLYFMLDFIILVLFLAQLNCPLQIVFFIYLSQLSLDFLVAWLRFPTIRKNSRFLISHCHWNLMGRISRILKIVALFISLFGNTFCLLLLH